MRRHHQRILGEGRPRCRKSSSKTNLYCIKISTAITSPHFPSAGFGPPPNPPTAHLSVFSPPRQKPEWRTKGAQRDEAERRKALISDPQIPGARLRLITWKIKEINNVKGVGLEEQGAAEPGRPGSEIKALV